MRSGTSRLGRLAPVCAAVLALCTGAAKADDGSGLIGPALQITGNGHQLSPAGRITTVGDFPTGVALTPDGRYAWVVDCGHGSDDVKIVEVATGAVTATLPLPGCYGGVAIAPDGGHAYVSGNPKGSSPTEGPTKGDAGDVVHVFTLTDGGARASEGNPISLPAVSGGSGQQNSLPPVSGAGTDQPSGLAVSPDGRWVVVALSTADAAAIVNTGSGAVTTVKVGAYPNGVAFDPQGRAYVSNEYDGTVSAIDPATGKVTGTIAGLGGQLGDLGSHPEGMAADPGRHRLYVAVTDRDLIAVIDTDRRVVTDRVSVARPEGLGSAPVALALSPDGGTLFAADSGEDALAAISLVARPATARVGRLPGPAVHGPHLVYPGIPVAFVGAYNAGQRRAARRLGRTHRRRAYDREHDRLVKRFLTPIGVRACGGPTLAQERAYARAVLAAIRGSRRRRVGRERAAAGRLPKVVACIPGTGTSGVVGYEPGLGALKLIGRIPTAAYPDAVAVSPGGSLVWVAGKGFGSGANPGFQFDGAKTQFQTPDTGYGTYVLDKLLGRVGVLAVPSDEDTTAKTPAADSQSRPANAEAAPAASPVPAALGAPSSQIKHVFYIVRENRTYDQVFGSEPRGDGEPRLELFDDNGVSGPTGGITPNAHALVRRFPLLDHFYEDSEVSVDGHIITAGAYANDYVQKATAANYSGRRKTFDFGVFPVTSPPHFYLFDQAAEQGVPFRVYGEGVGTIPTTEAPNRPQGSAVVASSDSSYPGNLFIGCLNASTNPVSCTQDSGTYVSGTTATGAKVAAQSRFDIWYPQFQRQVASGSVPALNYLILPNDHTNGTTTGDFTPQAMIADNDLALGQMVDAISRSSIWSSSAIFVVEDDSQDGADHVDSHRSPAFVISPWAKPGAVVHTRYDQYSVLRTIELILGLRPLSLNDALATPMYDAFISGGAQPDVTPYTVVSPTYNIGTKNGASAPLGALSDRLPFNRLDAVPQAISDRILTAAVRGIRYAAPSAGPDASPAERARAIRALTVLQSTGPRRRDRRSQQSGGHHA